MQKAIFGRYQEGDFGPCGCGKARATVPLAIPGSWFKGESEYEEINKLLEEHDFSYFGKGYDYRRWLSDYDRGDGYYLHYSACPACCLRAEALGIAVEGDVEGGDEE